MRTLILDINVKHWTHQKAVKDAAIIFSNYLLVFDFCWLKNRNRSIGQSSLKTNTVVGTAAAPVFPSRDHGVIFPILDSLHVSVAINGNTGTAVFLAERVAHVGDWIHGQFGIRILGLDADNAPGCSFD